MKKLLPALILGSIVLTACAAPYDRHHDHHHGDRHEQRYDRHDDRREYRGDRDYRRDGKYYDDDHIERQIYNDPSFEQKRAQAMRLLEQRGYRVHKIEADDRRGRPVLEAEGYKDGREYDIVLSWPDLKIISERIDY